MDKSIILLLPLKIIELQKIVLNVVHVVVKVISHLSNGYLNVPLIQILV